MGEVPIVRVARSWRWLWVAVLLGLPVGVSGAQQDERPAAIRIEAERPYVVQGVPTRLRIAVVGPAGRPIKSFREPVRVYGLWRPRPGLPPEELLETPPLQDGQLELANVLVSRSGVRVSWGHLSVQWVPRAIPGWLSVMPPLAAILLAVATREVLASLFLGVLLGVWIVEGYDPLRAFLRVLDRHVVESFLEPSNASILLFTAAWGGMIGVIACSGGMEALVQWLAHRVRSRRGGRLLGWLMGLIIFFDDYANCLLVGTTLRPFTDRLRISREKLSFIVDATGAPVATIAIVSTWIGYQLSQLEATGFIASGQVYDFFLRMLPYSFYSYFTVAFVFLNALLERDFGPMYWAELRAARDGLPLRPGAVPLMDADAMMPPSRRAAASPAGLVVALGSVVVIIIAVLAGLYLSGRAALGPDAAGANLRQILGASNPYQVLLWASFGAGFFAILASLALRVLSVGQAVDAWVAGVRSMMMAMIILVLAWTLGTLCREYLYTGPWLASQFQPPAVVMPAAIFLLCCLVSLATGTSFGTMAIVFPVATPMVWAATTPELIPDVAQAEVIRVASLAAVLSGAVFGDHCSPVSDTTILSSMASAADHIDHVRTQMPYAIVCAAVALLCGYVPATRGVSPVVSLAVGIFVLAGVLRVWGRPVR